MQLKRVLELRTLLALLLTMTLVLGACAPAPTAPVADEEAPATGEPTEVRFVIFNYDADVMPYWDDLVSRFEAENPDIDVKVESPPINEVRDRLITDVGANNAPDLAQVATPWMTEFAAAGAIEDWRDHLSPEFIDRLVPQLLGTGIYEGTLYGLPYLATSRALYVNTDLMAEAGIEEMPQTWDEYAQFAQDLVEALPEHDALALQGTGNEAFAAWFLYFLWSFGGDVYDEEGNLALNSPEAVAALEYMNQLVNEWEVTQPDVVSTDVPEQLTLFRTGQAATTITGPWMIGIMANEAPDVNYEVIPIPAGEEQVSLGVTDSLVMFNTADKEATVKFVEFFLQDENHFEYVQGRGMLPVLSSVAENPYFESDPKLKVHVELLDQVRFAPLVEEWNRVIDEGAKALQAVYLEQKTPQEALDDAVENILAARE